MRPEAIEGLELTASVGGTRLKLKVKPQARHRRILGVHGGALKLSVTAPPERGKANRAVLELLAEALDLAPGDVRLVSGETSPDKVVELPLAPARVRERLGRDRE